MAIATRAQRVQRRDEALKLIADGVPPTDAASQLTVKWGCSRRTSLRDIDIAQSELVKALQRLPSIPTNSIWNHTPRAMDHWKESLNRSICSAEH